MYLKKLITRARQKGVPVYCILLLVIYFLVRYGVDLKRDFVPHHLQKYLNFHENFRLSSAELQPHELRLALAAVERANSAREVHNERRYGPVRRDTTVLAVQVHRDVERLQYLIASLAQVHYIDDAVLIFSHSYYDEIINEMIKKITFCRFMQIYYPFSIQLNPKRFPGIDPEDCLSLTAPNAYCSKRDARRTEHKHHWWWKAHFVFNKLNWSEAYRGTVMFLDEDNYALPDLLYMLSYAKRSLAVIAGISVMVFGRPFSKDLDYDLFVVDTWRPPYVKGLAFNKTVWEKISALSSYFCTYDDLSWSYSLFNLFTRFREGHADMVSTMAPRVITTSLYGSGREAFENIHVLLKDASYYPERVKATMVISSTGRVNSEVHPPSKGTGGWSDIRDHLLCLDPLSNVEVTTDGTVDDTTTSTKLVVLPRLSYSSRFLVVPATDSRERNTSDDRMRK